MSTERKVDVSTLPTLELGDGMKAVAYLSPFVKVVQARVGVEVDGEFGRDTLAAVKRLQKIKGIEVDGIVGKDTWGAILESEPTTAVAIFNAPETLVSLARKDLGILEKKGNSGFFNAEFEKAISAVGWRRTNAWCEFENKKLLVETYAEYPEFCAIINRLFTGATQTTWRNLQRSAFFEMLGKIPEYGALVYYRHSLFTGHTGICSRAAGSSFSFISGNTTRAGGREGEIVAEKSDSTSNRRLLGFVRIPSYEKVESLLR